jgi:hypothetical protein
VTIGYHPSRTAHRGSDPPLTPGARAVATRGPDGRICRPQEAYAIGPGCATVGALAAAVLARAGPGPGRG